MKKMSYLFIIIFLPLVSSKITFFEGENMEYLVINESEENILFYCGDETCNNNETCKSCKIDCGKCVESNGYLPEADKNIILEQEKNKSKDSFFEQIIPGNRNFDRKRNQQIIEIILGLIISFVLFCFLCQLLRTKVRSVTTSVSTETLQYNTELFPS